MHSALLPNGMIVAASEYSPDRHGVNIHCMDASCKVPVIFIQQTDNTIPHFKTSGKGGSIHKPGCGFFKKLTFQESVSKVSEYQRTFQNSGLQEIIVRMNLNSIDPDYEPKSIEREKKEKKIDGVEVKIKKDNETPQTIASLKAVKKLFTGYEPDILASIMISVKGIKIAISELIQDYQKAHDALWSDELSSNLPYFVHGTVDKVIRRDKVWYVNFTNNFSLVVFERNFKHFTYKDEQLVGKEILAYGYLKKNTFIKERQSTEMLIKSNRYLEFL